MTGWVRTLDGQDVYTEDNEWYWFQSHQGWFHCPGLTLAPPTPPMDVRMREEARRLSTGWPSLRSALLPLPGRGEDISGNFFWRPFAWLLRAALLFILVFDVLHFPQFTRFAVSMFWPATDYARGLTNDYAVFVIPSVVAIFMITYILYMLRAWEVDEHKGNAMAAAAVAYSAYRGHQHNERARDQQSTRDRASELDRRHGGYGGSR